MINFCYLLLISVFDFELDFEFCILLTWLIVYLNFCYLLLISVFDFELDFEFYSPDSSCTYLLYKTLFFFYFRIWQMYHCDNNVFYIFLCFIILPYLIYKTLFIFYFKIWQMYHCEQ